mgnify:FL=1
MEMLNMKTVVNGLMNSYLGKARDSYNYRLILYKTGENELKSFQICVENNEDYTGKVAYASEYDLFTEDVGETWNIQDFKPFVDNAEVVVISNIEEV